MKGMKNLKRALKQKAEMSQPDRETRGTSERQMFVFGFLFSSMSFMRFMVNPPRPMTPIKPSEPPPRHRVTGATRLRNEAVFIGTGPGPTRAMLDYRTATITPFVRSK